MYLDIGLSTYSCSYQSSRGRAERKYIMHYRYCIQNSIVVAPVRMFTHHGCFFLDDGGDCSMEIRKCRVAIAVSMHGLRGGLYCDIHL